MAKSTHLILLEASDFSPAQKTLTEIVYPTGPLKRPATHYNGNF